MTRTRAIEVVLASLASVREFASGGASAEYSEETVLVGNQAVLDSLGVVSLIIEVEQTLEIDDDLSLTLASDKAMSQKNSPFRTVGVLADYICELAHNLELANQ
jgi:acyl carrier protein